MKIIRLAIFAAVVLAVASLAGFGKARAANPPIAGVLRIPTGPGANMRYFTNDTGKAIYLTGSHTWSNLICTGIGLNYDCTNPATPFDYDGYLGLMETNGHNFMRGWAWELSKFKMDPQSETTRYASPFPWSRTGPGNAKDGKLKFGLSQFDQSYFDQIRSRVIAAGERGIYVSIMLFEGWGIYYSPPPLRWDSHPFNSNNNVNGINGDPNGDGQGMESHTLQIPAIVKIQEDYVKKMVDTVGDLDNILYEISNEDHSGSIDWQYHFIDFIHNYESTKPKQHPVGMSTHSGIGNSPLAQSSAEWVSPTGVYGDPNDPYKVNPPVATSEKVSILDTDHVFGGGGDRKWVWKSFLRGHNPIYMDGLTDDAWGYDAVGARKAMGYTLTYAKKMNLNSMLPSSSSSDCSTTYCLRDPGQEYLVYQPSSGSFNVNLPAGNYIYEWFNPATGLVDGTGTASGGNKSFTPPFSDDAVLYLKKTNFTNECGNGTIEAGEACDDNNANNGDGCNSACQVESDWKCNGQSPVRCLYGVPYAPSDYISGITWNQSSLVRKAPGSDNFPMTWAADDNQYTIWGDGAGFNATYSESGDVPWRNSFGISRITGEPNSFTAINTFGGKNPEHSATFEGKAYGILSLGGVLYTFVGPGSGWDSCSYNKLAWSNDNGGTWQQSNNNFFTSSDKFCLPNILNYGKDYAGAKDEYVYLYSFDAVGETGPFKKIFLARVHKNDIKNRSAYEFFSGTSSNSQWSSAIGDSQPVFIDNTKGAKIPAVIYNDKIGRYLLTTINGDTSQLFIGNSNFGGLGIFDAPNPWGPWTIVEYADSWMGGNKMFFANIPTKWISSDGKDFYLVFTGTGTSGMAQDAYQHMKGTFLIYAPNNPADVNNDTRVNIKDIQSCIKVITQTNLTYQNQCRVLAAPDATTNIKDIQVIIRAIIGG